MGGWDFSKRRASRSCLYPLDRLGAEYAANPDERLGGADLDDDFDDFDAEWAANLAGDPNRCGAGETDANGLCPLHAGLPYRNMTDTAWEQVRLAIAARRQAADAAAAAWREVRVVKNARTAARADKWSALLDAVGRGGPVRWRQVSAGHKLRLAEEVELPEWAALELLAATAPPDPAAVGWYDDRPGPADPRFDVRYAVAGSPDQSGPVVRVLLADPNPHIRARAATFQRLPDDDALLDPLLLDPLAGPRMLRNRSVTGDRLAAAARQLLDPGSALMQRLTEPDYLTALDESALYPGSFLYRSPTTQTQRAKLLRAAAVHPNTPGAVVAALVRSGLLDYQTLAAIAQFHPHADAGVLAELAVSKWKTVRDAAAARQLPAGR